MSLFEIRARVGQYENPYLYHQRAALIMDTTDREYLTAVDPLDRDQLIIRAPQVPDVGVVAPVEMPAPGQPVPYVLCAAVTSTPWGTKKRYPVFDQQIIGRWIRRKSIENGFETANCRFEVTPVTVDKGGHRFTVAEVLIWGHLTVADPTKFEAVMYHGMGRMKHLPYGMVRTF